VAEDVAERIEAGAQPGELLDLRDFVQVAPEMQRFYIASAVRCLNDQRRHFDIVSRQMLFTPDYDTQMRAASFLACLAGNMQGPFYGPIFGPVANSHRDPRFKRPWRHLLHSATISYWH